MDLAVALFIAAIVSPIEKKDLEELLERFEGAAEEVQGEDVKRVSQTELAATLTYSYKTDKDNNIYYRVLKSLVLKPVILNSGIYPEQNV